MKNFTVMRFLSFSNKKKLRQKDWNPEPGASDVRPGKRVKICHFFLVNLLRTFERFLSG
jgi:hypothetical protein